MRLFFQGTKHPGVAEMPIVEQSRELAAEPGRRSTRHVFFNETWVPYDERQNYLLEADAGASTHGFTLETTLAFRTRILDYLWTGLPMVLTEGDSFAELVEREELGVAVPPDDVDALAKALELMLSTPSGRGSEGEHPARLTSASAGRTCSPALGLRAGPLGSARPEADRDGERREHPHRQGIRAALRPGSGAVTTSAPAHPAWWQKVSERRRAKAVDAG